MPLFLLFFIVFLIWFRVKMKQNNSVHSQEDMAYWEREQKANFVRKQDISHLEHLVVSLEKLPFSKDAVLDEEERHLEEQVKKTASKDMMNLSGYSNTDLKEQYGMGNLDELTELDQNYMYFIRALSQWGVYLCTHEQYDRSRQVMEYSRSIGSDISSVYTTLGEIYARAGESRKIDELIDFVEASDFALKDSILKKLKLSKLEY